MAPKLDLPEAVSDFGPGFISAVVAVGAIGAILHFSGIGIQAEMIFWLFVAVAGGSLLARRTVDISVGFVIISAALLLVIIDYLIPNSVLAPFQPITDAIVGFTGIDFSQLDTLQVLALALVFVFLMLYLRVWLAQERKFPRKAADLALNRMALYVRGYFTIGRLVMFFAFTAVVIALGQTAQLFGEAGNLIAEVPFVASNFAVALVGYLSLGGQIPIIGTIPPFDSLGAAGLLVISAIIIILAAAVAFESGGPLANFLRNQR